MFRFRGQAAPTEKTSSETSMQGAPGLALFPQLALGLQMHRPRQGCTSLGSTEGLLCSGSWSPDALIETLHPCRNQREGKGKQGRGCKHIWHLQKTLHTTLRKSREKRTGHIEKRAWFSLCYHTWSCRYTHPHTYLIVCLPHLQSRKVIMWGTGQEGTTILQLVGHHQNTLCYCSIYTAHQTMPCCHLKEQIIYRPSILRGNGIKQCYYRWYIYTSLYIHMVRYIKAVKGKINEKLWKEDTIESESECKKFVWVHVSARCLFGVFASFAWALPFALGGSTGRS